MNIVLEEAVEDISATEKNDIGTVVRGWGFRVFLVVGFLTRVCCFPGDSWQQYHPNGRARKG